MQWLSDLRFGHFPAEKPIRGPRNFLRSFSQLLHVFEFGLSFATSLVLSSPWTAIIQGKETLQLTTVTLVYVASLTANSVFGR